MSGHTDAETARQLEELWNTITRGIDYAQEVLERSRQVEAEVSQHCTTVVDRASQAQTTKLEISEIAHKVEQTQAAVRQLQVTVEEKVQTAKQLCNEVVSTVAQFGGQETLQALQQELQDARTRLSEATTRLQQAEERLHTFEAQLQERSVALGELASQVEKDKTTISQLVQQTEGRAKEVLQVKSELQFYDNVASTLRQIQGQVEEKCRAFEARLQAHSTAQEQRSSEIFNLAQQVRADLEAIQRVGLEAESLRTADERHVNALLTLVYEQRGEIERLNKQLHESQAELGQKLQSVAQNQQVLRNWLLGVTFGVALALALAIRVAR